MFPRCSAAALVREFTEVDIEALRWLVEGLGDRGIAAKPAVPVTTMKRHLREIHRKLMLQDQGIGGLTRLERALLGSLDLRTLILPEIRKRFVEAIVETIGDTNLAWDPSRRNEHIGREVHTL